MKPEVVIRAIVDLLCPPTFMLVLWLTMPFPKLVAQAYQVNIMDVSGEPIYGVLAIDDNQQLLGESDLAGRIDFPARLNAADSISFRLFGFAPLRGTPASLGLTRGKRMSLTMVAAARQLATVAVIGRRNELARDLNYRVETISAKDVDRVQSGTTVDALSDLSGVYVQKSQFGGGSPVLRGLEANRVLLVVDGVRMNNAIFRNGHLQNAITVDVNSLERMEVIYGPGSLAYGSDALGGVIHFRTREPRFRTNEPGWSTQASLTFGSAANRWTSGLSAEYGSHKLASYTQLSYSNFGDLRAGNKRPAAFPAFGLRTQYVRRIEGEDQLVDNDQPNVQSPSGYQQYDLLQKFRFSLADGLELSANFQASTSADIPRYDALTELQDGELRWAEWNYGPQTRLMGSIRLADRRGARLWDVSNVLVSHQFVSEDRIQRRKDDPLRESSLVDVHSTNLQWDLSKSLPTGGSIRYGADARIDYVSARTELLDVETGNLMTTGLATRYPSEGSRLGTAGLFVDYRYTLTPKWEVSVGGRYSRQWLQSTFGADEPVEWPAEYLSGVSNNEGAFTSSAGLQYRSDAHRWRFLFAQGFRAPNVDDFAKFRERNGFIQIPNPELGSERSNSIELGYDYQDDNWFLATGVFFSRLNNAIIRRDFQLPNGQDFFLSFGDTLRVQANVNAESADIYGFDLDIRRRIGEYWQLRTDFHWLRGRRQQSDPRGGTIFLPQDHIPPAYGQFGVRFEKERLYAGLRIRYQLAKSLEDYAVGAITAEEDGRLQFDRTGTSDNLEFTPRDPQTGAFAGAYGWWTLNLNGEYQLSEQFTLRLSAENLLDVHYRPFASGISAPGRNLVLGVVFTNKPG